MAKSSIYYIRPNHTGALPTNLLFLDVETRGQPTGDGTEFHTMYLGWTWHLQLGPGGTEDRSQWVYHTEPESVYAEVIRKVQPRKPLYILGSNVTFDLFASGLASNLQHDGWKASLLYDKGLVTIIILKRAERTIKILALQNFLQGSVKEWGALLNLPKMEVNLNHDNEQSIRDYCKRDVEISGKTFLSYLSFLRHNDMGGFSPTLSGQSFRAFRHRYMKHKILHYDVPSYNEFIRNSYFGGRTDCHFIGKAQPQSYTKVDINSMYPAVLRNNYFPTKIRQWVQHPTFERIKKRLTDHCITARCRMRSDEPAYAVRDNDRLIFPTGDFTAMLSTGSLRYALQHNHIVQIEEAAIFYRANLFKKYVDHFYALRQQYKAEGNAVWEKTAKLLLNALYGKFGEKRMEELVRADAEPTDFYRTAWTNYDTGESGIEWSAFNTFVREGGEREGPQSAPAIAAHVTDYGRIQLWQYIKRVGRDNVYYCDTDSLIIPTSHLPKLRAVLDDTKLGLLKVEGEAHALEIRNCKDYSFGAEVRRKGVRSTAYHNSDGSFTQTRFASLHTLLRTGTLNAVPVYLTTKSLTHQYDKGVVTDSGFVEPIRLY